MARFYIACAFALLLSPAGPALASSPWLPPLEVSSMPGTWEGLCIELEKTGKVVFAIRLHLHGGEQGSLAVGFWTGAPNPVVQDTLNVDRLTVRKGRVALVARDGR